MKILTICMLILTTIFASAKTQISSFDHWDIVAIINVTNGNVTTTILHCLPEILKGEERKKFDKEVGEWASRLKDQSFVYAICFQNGKKKSSTWQISIKTYDELNKISLIMQDANVHGVND